MKLSLIEGDENYAARVVTINNLQDLPGLDNLRGTYIDGNLVLVGKDTLIGMTGVFFLAETQLGLLYCSANNLFKHGELNSNPATRGYIEENRRVKALKLKGYISTGLWMPLSSLVAIVGVGGFDDLDVGDTFHKLNGVEICCKYRRKGRTPGLPDRNEPKATGPRTRVNERAFAQHVRTSHLFANMDKLTGDEYIRLTRKLHGTSARVGLVPVHRGWTWWRRALRKLRIDQQLYDWQFVVGSRQVIKSVNGETKRNGDFYKENVWNESAKVFEGKLHKGECIYYEIIGWTANGRPLQKGYTYGLEPGSHKIYIYRITMANEDGVAHDLPLPALRERCAQLGVDLVPVLFYGTSTGLYGQLTNQGSIWVIPDNWRDLLRDAIQDRFLDKPSALDSSIVEEGVVMTVESLGVHYHFKAKSPKFLLHETKVLDDKEDNSIGDEDTNDPAV